MADAKPGVHVVKLRPINVPADLQEGNKFIKWDDVSTFSYFHILIILLVRPEHPGILVFI